MIFILISSIVILDLNPFSHSLINLQSIVWNTYPRRLSFSFENRNWKFVSNLSEENIIVSNIFHECLFSIEMNSWKEASCINFKSFRYFSRTEYERQKVSTLLEPNFSASTNFSSFVFYSFFELTENCIIGDSRFEGKVAKRLIRQSRERSEDI